MDGRAPARGPRGATASNTAASASTPRRGTSATPHVEPAEDRTRWRVQQMLVDPEGLNDWVAELDVDLAASREGGEPVVRLLRLGSLV